MKIVCYNTANQGEWNLLVKLLDALHRKHIVSITSSASDAPYHPLNHFVTVVYEEKNG